MPEKNSLIGAEVLDIKGDRYTFGKTTDDDYYVIVIIDFSIDKEVSISVAPTLRNSEKWNELYTKYVTKMNNVLNDEIKKSTGDNREGE